MLALLALLLIFLFQTLATESNAFLEGTYAVINNSANAL